MRHYFTAPVSTPEPFINYEKTVLHGIKKDFFNEYPEIESQLLNNEKVFLWGLTFKKHSSWAKVKPHDKIMFYKLGFLISYSTVNFTIENSKVAEELWGIANKKYYAPYTWPLLIFLSSPTPINIPYSTINDLSGYQPNYVCKSFNILNQKFHQSVDKEYGSFDKFIKKESNK